MVEHVRRFHDVVVNADHDHVFGVHGAPQGPLNVYITRVNRSSVPSTRAYADGTGGG
jgi:hypothetical protein